MKWIESVNYKNDVRDESLGSNNDNHTMTLIAYGSIDSDEMTVL